MESVPSSGALAGGGAAAYPDSADSSPRSRGGDSWDEQFPSSAAAAAAAAAGGGRLRLMCSFGGRIVPRPTDKSLCYLGGETRIVAVDRHGSLADLHARLSRSLLGGLPFSLKYQLPNEDLDSLISVSTDEDLENLIDEYDRIAAAAASSNSSSGTTGAANSRTSRIRLFLFPAKPESSSSLGSLLDDSSKSETWFVDALNSAMSGSLDSIPRGSADSASVNCLLGLEDDSSTHSRSAAAAVAAAAAAPAAGEQKAAPRYHHHQDVQSVPDSPMLDKNSSFGSTSSAPSLSNLPPIRVRSDGLEDHFAHMAISEQPPPPVYLQQSAPPPAVSGPTPTISPSETSSRVFSDDDKSDHGGGGRRQQQPQQQQLKPAGIDPAVADSTNRAMYYNERSPPSEMKREMPVHGADGGVYRIPVQAPEAAAAATGGYMYAPIHQPPPQPQQPPPPPPQQQPPPQPAPQQFVAAQPPPNQHYIHNPATGTYMPVQSYYHHPIQQAPPPQQSHHPFDPNVPMYYLPVRQNAPQPYNLGPAAVPPPNLVDTTPKPTVPVPQLAVKPELQQPNMYRTAVTAAAPAPVPVPVPAPAPAPAPTAAATYAGMAYHHMMHPHHPSQTPTTVAATYGYEYPDPARAQVYFSQAAPPPSLPPQYQNLGSPDAGQVDPKQTRAS